MKVTTAVLEVLDRAETDGPALRLTGQLDRKLYLDANKVLEAAGGKWNRAKKAHLFDGDAADAIEQVILTGQVVSKKQEFGYFPTPAPIVAQLIEHARIKPGMSVLEPSAGRGAIAGPIAALGAHVDCVELQPENVAALESLPGVNGLLTGDFLNLRPDLASYDRVVMNPPFARQQDIAHVLHAMGFLKPNGLLVAVMATGVMFRAGRAEEFRKLVADRGGHFEALPDDSFKESGTGVNTVIAVIPAA